MENFVELVENIDSFDIYCIKNDICITKYIKHHKIMWESWMEQYIKEIYEENTNIVDVGAHIGTFSLMASKYISPNYKIYSFEPVYTKILEMNIEKNNLLEKVIFSSNGLSNKQKTIPGFYIDFNKSQNYGFIKVDEIFCENKNKETKIYLDTLDNLNIENISILKIDVEGNELEVLEGAFNTILKNKPSILIEIWSTSPNEKLKEKNEKQTYLNLECFSFLFKLEYICFPISPETDDFLFVHSSKKNILNKMIHLLNKNP